MSESSKLDGDLDLSQIRELVEFIDITGLVDDKIEYWLDVNDMSNYGLARNEMKYLISLLIRELK